MIIDSRGTNRWGLIDSVPDRTPAWFVTDHRPLLSVMLRGQNRILPGAEPGIIEHPKRVTANQVDLFMHFDGRRAPDGTLHTDPIDGLDANYDAFVTAVVEPPNNADSTRTYTLHRPTLATVATTVQIVELTPLESDGFVGNAVLIVELTRGRLAPVGS